MRDNKKLIIIGPGPIPDYQFDEYYYRSNAPWGNALTSVNAIVIQDGVTSIGNNAFRGSEGSIKSVKIPDGVTRIGNHAFYLCALTSVTIPDSVTSIGDYAFYCNSLTSVTIPDSVTSIGDYAFSGNSLTSVTIPDSVTSIGNNPFRNNPFRNCNLASIIVSPHHPVLAVVDGGLIRKTDKRFICYPAGLKAVTYSIPDSVTSIGDTAFYYCSNLTGVTIPDSVTSIGDFAFYHCNNLTGVTIPDSVTSIGDSAFSYCVSLTSVTIPDSVTSIGEHAFEYEYWNGRENVLYPINNLVVTSGSYAETYCKQHNLKYVAVEPAPKKTAATEGILPGLGELFNTPMPSARFAVDRAPDNETADAGGITQSWAVFTDADYNAFSTYLGQSGAALVDNSIAAGVLTATIGLDDLTFVMTYDWNAKTLSVFYPAGTAPEDEKWQALNASSPQDAAARSIFSNPKVKELIASSPALSIQEKKTVDFFTDEKAYKTNFPKADTVHTWWIRIEPGLVVFMDEFDSKAYVIAKSGKAGEVLPVMRWEVAVMEAVPEIAEAAEQLGIRLIAERKIASNSDYRQHADANGMIDLTNPTKRTGVISQEKGYIGFMEVMDAMSGLEALDTNGNGRIDPEEIFEQN